MTTAYVHFVSRPALRASQESRSKLLVTACGTIAPDHASPTPRLVSCPRCKNLMLSEERNP